MLKSLDKPKERALKRLEKEPDIVNFIKKQIKVNVILDTIFTKLERILVRKNKRFDLN